jgi:hypothetical protein
MIGGDDAVDLGTALLSTKVMTVIPATPSPMAFPMIHLIY